MTFGERQCARFSPGYSFAFLLTCIEVLERLNFGSCHPLVRVQAFLISYSENSKITRAMIIVPFQLLIIKSVYLLLCKKSSKKLPLTGRSRAWTGNPRVCEPEVCPGRAAPNRLMNEFYLSRSTTASLCLLSVAASLSP